eukprot:PITA_33471
MTYWKSKVLPKIKKYFGKGDANSKGAASFNKAKNSIGKEIEEKKRELEPKITEIYQDSKPETKLLFKEPTEDKIQYLLEKLSPFVANEESPVIAIELDLVKGGAENAVETAKDISEAPVVLAGDENVKETTAKVEKEVEIVGTKEKGHL